MTDMDILIKASLLHDIGKLCCYSDSNIKNYSEASIEFLSNVSEDSDYVRKILNCISAFNSISIPKASDDNNMAYIIYEANSIADSEEEYISKSIDEPNCLHSIFNIFGDIKSKDVSKYYPIELSGKNKFNYPYVYNKTNALKKEYKKLVDILAYNFHAEPFEKMDNNRLLTILEDTVSFVSDCANKKSVSDISLYIHSKITAAIASCMYQYFAAKNITDYKKYCFSKANAEFRNESAFLLISGDFSGIQSFIYTIPSKGALKSLRGRSFYLEILMENFIDEMLKALDLCRANLLYTGGGHFYVLAANTEKTRQTIEALKVKLNQWLLAKFGTQLYMAMGYAQCSANDLRSSGTQRNVFAAVSKELNKDKLCRYDADSLEQLFDSNSIYNKNMDKARECSICHLSSTELQKVDNISEGYICSTCAGLYELGGVLFQKEVFVILDTAVENSLEVFGRDTQLYLAVVNNKELGKYADHIVRIYSKNEAVTGKFISTRLWLADYYSAGERGEVLEFEKLAEVCCDGKHGIKRLGVLRADVDNLGAAFIGGFVHQQAAEPEKYATLSRYADLSRDLGLFFKLAVDKLCKGELTGFDINDKQQPFSLFGLSKDKQRKVHVVYSGGDDMFIVGAWDELLELAVDIRRAFSKFTNDKLSFSAGLALFNPSYPISKMAEITGMLEGAAKDNGKNSIALFGLETEQHDRETKLACKHVYQWPDFTAKVCAEKLQFLLDHLTFENAENKIKAGISLLYRLLDLIEYKQNDKIDIARFAYTLGRMQPASRDNPSLQACYAEFSQQMYQWYIHEEDRKQLFTALNLLIYYRREAREA